ncbi:uncharacterized protein FFB20_11801 [Fusarium fujikuroi]|uniref:Uncharacterized protein n=2 Tax=Fusarium fujikuroi TaxID=5127 RepID=S0EAF6_GIBF5|nr:uncharacterized protein FFUJ_05817 [Fusarium fujikuroi IMI 58289]KLP14480.1 uncharacterized protein LW94_13233 [Fusarium fujikuroi]QGI65735.1 hypothetical protein CEK27_009706 [Fusarium fujikuroi]QGI82977.1 hypothetical protein CEK25_009706 [Fusarium fujikuroi]QGI96616.1 hypothetical protein CEK26_009685 [Fusarium fujikuroi]CCT70742.1 uncharacterized protein FFUJ_05817 [Fusarium fujikuroi IMI 58289]
MLLPKLSLLAVMAIPVAALNCQNEVTDATIDRNWLLSGCGPCRKNSFETHPEVPNDDAGRFRYDEDNDATYKSICNVCRSNFGPKQPDKVITSQTSVLSLPKETPTIASMETTHAKPRIGWLDPPGPSDGATFSNNDPQQSESSITSSSAALKLPKETPSITSIRITQTKPRVGWSTLPGPDDGTTLAWFTKTTTHTETETETTTTTASTTIDLKKSTATSMGLSETTETSMSPGKSTATSMGLTETSATLDPEETDTPTPQKKKHTAGLQTAGIIIAILFFIVFTVLVTWKCLQHHRQIQFDEDPEEPMGEANDAGGSAFDDSDSEAEEGQARNLVASVRDWFRRHQFPFPPPNEPEEPDPDDGEADDGEADDGEPEPHPVPPPPPPPPPIPEQPVQAPTAVVHPFIPRTTRAIPGHQVQAPSVQVPTPDPAQDRSSSSVYSQDSGYLNSVEMPRPLSINRSRRRQEQPQPPQEWRTTGEPVQTGNYGWI